MHGLESLRQWGPLDGPVQLLAVDKLFSTPREARMEQTSLRGVQIMSSHLRTTTLAQGVRQGRDVTKGGGPCAGKVSNSGVSTGVHLFPQSQPSINALFLSPPLTTRAPALELVVIDGPGSIAAMSNKIVVS